MPQPTSARIVGHVVRAVGPLMLVAPLLQDAGVMLQPLARVGVVADEPMLRSDALAKPDDHVVIDPEVPERIDRHVLMRDAADAALLADARHLLGIVGALNRGLERLFDSGGELALHLLAHG